MADVSLPSGDTAPALTGTLTIPSGAPLNLTSASEVRIRMRLAADRRMKVDAEATVVDAAAGSVRYDWAPGDLDMAGNYTMRWRVLWGDGTIQDTEPQNTITVEPD